MTRPHLALLGAVSLLALVESPAVEKEFLLSGTRWRLPEVTGEVAVQFQAMRTNRASGGWNVSVHLVNRGTNDLHTPLVLSLDAYTGTTGPVDADGYDEDFPPKPFYNLSALQPDGVLLPGNSTLSRTLALGPGALPSLTTRVFAWIPPPGFRITGISFGPDGNPLIEHIADTNSYFILLAGTQLTNITFAADMALPLGTNGLGQLRDFISAHTNATRFFRVRKVPLSQPLDSDHDGIDDVWELHRIATQYPLNPLDPTDANTDPDGNGLTHLQEYLGAVLPLTTIVESSPANGESGIALSRETIFRFNHPLSPSTLLTTNNLRATFAGRQILARVEFSSDRKKVTLFYQEPLPASARIRVTFNSTNLTDYLGRALDLDGDGQPGGNAILDFDTLSITPVAGTAVFGHVFASLQVPVVNTNNTTTNFVNQPLPGVLISVIGAEQDIFTTTDAQGFFRLTNCPAGKFFVSVDGRTATNGIPNGHLRWDERDYYPLVGKPWEAVAGRTNNLAGGTGLIYLPLVQAGTLQPVNPTADTTISFPGNIVAANPAWAGVSVTIPTNALFSDNGTRGGRVGLAPVPADRLPERLPAGIVHALDISIQTDGPQNVDRPLPVRFPNLPDPQTGLKLPPGAKSALMSYNHDTGRWEVQGPMTVTADGNYVETDPGVGVRQPGWHGVMPGTMGTGGPIGPPPPCTTPPTCVASSSLSGGTAKASHVNACAGKTISFEATGVIAHPGTLEACDGTTSATSGGPVEYKWEITRNGTKVLSGNGTTASVPFPQPGTYACTFTIEVKDECPSGPTTLNSPSVAVASFSSNPNDIDCDGIPNGQDGDMDGDGISNNQDGDRDGDGIPNDQDPNPDGEACDTCPVADVIEETPNDPGILAPALVIARNRLRDLVLAEPVPRSFEVTSEYRSLRYQTHFYSLRTTYIELKKLQGITGDKCGNSSHLTIAADSPFLCCQALVDELNREICVTHGIRARTDDGTPAVSNPDDPENLSHTLGPNGEEGVSRAFDAKIEGLTETRIDELAAQAGLYRPYRATDPVHFELCPDPDDCPP